MGHTPDDRTPTADVAAATRRADGTEILPTDPDALTVLVRLGILEVVSDDPDPARAIYRMIDPEGVKRALDEIASL